MLAAAAVLIGSQTCRPCHATIFDSYSRTPMARSSGRVDQVADARFSAAGHRYQITGNTLRFDGGSVPFDWFIGSGSAGRSYLRQHDGYLYELPVSWYAQNQKWDASPGYQNDTEIRLTRAVEPACLQCHATRVRPVLGTQNRFGDPPFLETGIGCERCHGPGSEHVRNPAKARLVHPARLDAERRDAVCSQCHLTGEARIERPGRTMAEFQPGQRLDDYVTYFVWQNSRRDLKVTSHVERLAASACKRAAGDRLWCGTCHDVHTNEDKTQTACLSCHAGAHRQKERCANCHMPRTRASDAGGHGVMTDHAIPRAPAKGSAARAGGVLVPFLGTADDRGLGLAYAEIGDRRAAGFLAKASPRDWRVRLRLAVLATDPAAAARLYEELLAGNPYEPNALVNLGVIRAREGRLAEAGRLWERALVVNPALEQAVLNLSQIRSSAEAVQILERYLKLDPVAKAVRERLAQIR